MLAPRLNLVSKRVFMQSKTVYLVNQRNIIFGGEKISKDFMPLLTDNNKKALAAPQDMISLFELNLLSAFSFFFVVVLQCCLRAFPVSATRLRVWQVYFFVIFSSCEIKSQG